MTVWMKILDDIVDDIVNGVYTPDVKLPSEHELVERYGVKRYDVRKAYERLTDMGYIYSVQGKGRYYKSKHDKIELILAGDASFTEKMLKKGFDLKSINIDFTELKNAPKIRKKLNALDTEKVFKITRVRIINGEPAAIHVSYVTDRLFKNINEDGPNITSMFSYYKSKGFNSFYYKQSDLQTMLPTRIERNLLKCPSLVPIMLLESQCYDADSDEILETTKIIYRSDRFVYRISSDD